MIDAFPVAPYAGNPPTAGISSVVVVHNVVGTFPSPWQVNTDETKRPVWHN